MVASTSIPLSSKSHEIFIEYYRTVNNVSRTFRSSLRTRLEARDKAYQREKDKTKEHQRAKNANNAGDTDRFQNITVPVVMPSVETAVTHQTSVFLTGHPIFGVVSSPEFADEALQLETIIEEHSTLGGWQRELILFFRDGYKYNFAPIEVSWDRQVSYSIETDLQTNIGEGKPKKVIWTGNAVRRLDPYNTIVDPRVAPTEVYKDGEFAGYTERVTRIKLKLLMEALPDMNPLQTKQALESGLGNGINNTIEWDGFYVPDINPDMHPEDSEVGTGTNWISWVGLSDRSKDIDYKDMYDVTTLYCRILPDEFNLKLPARNTPQVFKLIIINHEHIIYCERQTNAHNWIPILVGQPHEDGLRYQTKSQVDNVEPFQDVATAYMNSIIHSRRRAITDRVLYDPSRISAAQINSDNPSAKIPVRPAAYGKNIGEAVYQFPYREDQGQYSIVQIHQLLALANQLTGQNQASHGQFVKGNKTLEEFDTVMQNANGRNQTSAILLEFQVFIPLKHILKINILQYQGGTTLYNRDQEKQVEIDPIKLRRAVLNFKVSDGLLPSSKLMNAESFAVALQTMGSSSQLAAGYNVTQLFSYLMKSRGAKISAFEKPPEQMAYEQAYSDWRAIAFEYAKQGIDATKLPQQPKPQDYGYNPPNTTQAPKDPENPTQTQPESGVQ